MNFALTGGHSLSLNNRMWDVMKLNCEYLSFFPLHQAFVSQSAKNHEWLKMHFFLIFINARRHDLDLRGKSIMCAQVHVWEVWACIFNVAFYLNEGNRGCGPGKVCVHLFLWKTWCIEKCCDWTGCVVLVVISYILFPNNLKKCVLP